VIRAKPEPASVEVDMGTAGLLADAKASGASVGQLVDSPGWCATQFGRSLFAKEYARQSCSTRAPSRGSGCELPVCHSAALAFCMWERLSVALPSQWSIYGCC
jgi:hypothetical protein